MVYPNGRLPAGALTDMPGEPGARLVAACAQDWAWIRAEVQRRYGWTPRITSIADAYRSYEIQERIFRARYTMTFDSGINQVPARTKFWLGRTWYLRRGQATAATPGTSNHGQGVGVDVTGLGPFDSLRYRQFADVASERGWSNAEGRSIGEPWHWTKTTAILTGNEVGGGGAVPNVPDLDPLNPLTPEDDMPTPDELFNAPLFTIDGQTLRLRDVLLKIMQETPGKVWEAPIQRPEGAGPIPAGQLVGWMDKGVSATAELAAAGTAAKVWAEQINRPAGQGPMPAGELLGWIDNGVSQTYAGLSSLAALAAERAGLTPDVVAKIAQEASSLTREDIARRLTETDKG